MSLNGFLGCLFIAETYNGFKTKEVGQGVLNLCIESWLLNWCNMLTIASRVAPWEFATFKKGSQLVGEGCSN